MCTCDELTQELENRIERADLGDLVGSDAETDAAGGKEMATTRCWQRQRAICERVCAAQPPQCPAQSRQVVVLKYMSISDPSRSGRLVIIRSDCWHAQ